MTVWVPGDVGPYSALREVLADPLGIELLPRRTDAAAGDGVEDEASGAVTNATPVDDDETLVAGAGHAIAVLVKGVS